MKKSQSDFNSVRSPSSLGMTQATQLTKMTGSQSSLRSAISLKESPTISTAKSVPLEKKEKYQEREVDVKSDKSDKMSTISSSTSTNTSSMKKDLLTSSPVPQPRSVHKTSRTILESGIPQTEV